MTPEQLLSHYKTKSAIGRALGASPSTVSEWFEIGYVPEGRQYQVELATHGMLKADKPANRLSEQEAA